MVDTDQMKKVIVIGCPGAGKSTFSRKLVAKTGLPLYYLDMIWHRPDRTTVTREGFDVRLSEIISRDEWVLDGNYLRTLPLRLKHCDTVFFFDLPLETCLAGAESRLGKDRVDMPWTENELDEEFRQWIINFPKQQLPIIELLLENYEQNVKIIKFKSHREADEFIESL